MGVPKLYSKHEFIGVGGGEFNKMAGSAATLLLLESLIPAVPQGDKSFLLSGTCNNFVRQNRKSGPK
jgi:hypothetical protein